MGWAGEIRAMSDNPELEAKLEALRKRPEIDLDAPCTFTCHGCGHRCCTDRTDIIVTSYELIRIAWYLATLAEDYPQHAIAIEGLGQNAFGLIQGGSSGMPLMQVDFELAGPDITACPFLVPATEIPSAGGPPALVNALEIEPETLAKDVMFSLCGIHAVRPRSCRLYPLGGIASVDQNTGAKEDWRYFQQDVSCGETGPRADGLTWREFLGGSAHAEATEGRSVYDSMSSCVFETLKRSGIESEHATLWVREPRRSFALALLFYLIPATYVPPRELRTHEAAMELCRQAESMLLYLMHTLLFGQNPSIPQMLQRFTEGVAERLAIEVPVGEVDGAE